ncbi:NAD(P)-binding domain-containing protein [Streptomyces sp. NBC_00237]|uniref:lactate/malate family dehydrogenase n=1 Tax=Streptomyces sp. NBC_00237 TaxID=2975687 RepID=UPI002255D58F|nr:NAD(P)-binding domain-containing protein [Streptomyces sp. NBC_00237]MCX5205714.1 NAD(P)-binding domain-containing protein [Streptomyces sp. NBC_00237]
MTGAGPVRSVGIIGAGAVGHTVATLLTAAGWCSGLRIASGSDRSAAALLADLEDMQQVLGSPVRAEISDVSAMADCDAVVVCPRAKFTNTAARDIRMAGLAVNAPVIATLGRQLAGYAGTAVVVTNPVDVMTRVFAEASGSGRVFGVGSNTDTARYRLTLARLLAVPVESVHGHVIGEHGDAAVVCAAATRVGGLPAAVPLRAVHDELSDRPRRINAGVGRARSGPAGAVLAALRAALGLTDAVVELCVNHGGNWAGMPVRFTSGTPTITVPDLDPTEGRLLAAATTKLHTAYNTLPRLTEGDPTQ